MRMVDMIRKKRDGGRLEPQELAFFVQGITTGTIPDYQAVALLMAIYFRGMTHEETACLTLEMARSGDRADLSSLPGVKVDKHSTGGVGDKTTLICGPMAAACGVTVAKMSGRGLGHTGGTVDKLESIPGLRTDLSRESFFQIVRNTGMALIGQSGNLCPADKKLYALRDVTATVESLPLIASSIMSKKIASGADAVLLDVKVGSGAFLKTGKEARALAEEMVAIGQRAGRRTVALITDMDRPLGRCIGNALEVREAAEVLRGRGEDRLSRLCVELAAHMILLAGQAGTPEEARNRARQAISSGAAFRQLCATVQAQGGDVSCLEAPEKLGLSPCCREVPAPAEGYITALDAEGCGLAAMELGAGREVKEDDIDPGAGVVLLKNKGDYVRAGEPLARVYSAGEALCRRGEERLLAALTLGPEAPGPDPLILGQVGAGPESWEKVSVQ